MPKFTIPENAGPYHIATARAGNLMVRNANTGRKRVVIPCRDREEAKEICRRLNDGDHNGTIHASGA